MDIKKLILQRIDKNGKVTSKEIQDASGITRQSAHKYFKALREQGIIQKIGKTKSVKYIRKDSNFNTQHSIHRTFTNKNLLEDNIFQSLALELRLENQVTPRANDIITYAFTELMNNAIEHSQSPKIRVRFQLKQYNAEFRIKDYGIGIFGHIKDHFDLLSERDAVQDLLKGKTTTDKTRHSGEGIFFSSKVADIMRIKSHRLALNFDNPSEEIYTQTIPYQEGTEIDFILSRNSKKSITEIFEQYSGEEFDYSFSKTKVTVALYTKRKQQFVSRSEAKRLLQGLDKFQRIILDFQGVKSIGQGFADQVFRIFLQQHPEIEIETRNTTDAVVAMIMHVKSS